MRPRVYIETTIPSFYHNNRRDSGNVAKQRLTRLFWDQRRFDYDLFTSVLVRGELDAGNHENKQAKLQLIERVGVFSVTAEAAALAEAYVTQLAMPARPFADAMHLALAAVNKCHIILTWNCAHLANENKQPHLARVTREFGYDLPRVITPATLLGVDVYER